MQSEFVTVDTIFGPLELRPRHAHTDRHKLPFAFFEHSVKRALTDELKYGNALAVMRLARQEALVPWIIGAEDQDIVEGIMAALRGDRLIASTPGANGGQADEQTALWSAYYAFQSRFGKTFQIAMRRHRIVGREQAAEIRQAEDYDVVNAAEAAALLVRMSQTAGAGPWQAATNTLAQNMVDLRSPPSSVGFVLLRAPVSYVERQVNPEDVITPAKLKKLAAKNWLEVLVYGRDGKALANVKLEITLPNGDVQTEVTPSSGKVRINEIFESGGGQIAVLEIGKLVVRKK